MSKIATRDGFGDEIVELGRENKNILVVDVDIGKSCKTTNFAKQLPAQHVNVGIAEQSGAGVAAVCDLRQDTLRRDLRGIRLHAYVRNDPSGDMLPSS